MSTRSILSFAEVHGDQRTTAYAIQPVMILDKHRNMEGIDSYRLQSVDLGFLRAYRFSTTQINMVYAFGVWEGAISIVSRRAEIPQSCDPCRRASEQSNRWRYEAK